MKDENLKERTKAFPLSIIKLYSFLPKRAEAQVIGKQILRSGTLVGANYREGSRARSTQEFIAKLGICLQELEETTYWLELLVDSGLVKKDVVNPALKESNELTAIFVSSIRTLKKGRSKK